MPKKKHKSKPTRTRKGNRKYKDSVFIGYLTEKPERLLSLYRALSDDNTATVGDIRINSIHTTFTQGTYNDISFTMKMLKYSTNVKNYVNIAILFTEYATIGKMVNHCMMLSSSR